MKLPRLVTLRTSSDRRGEYTRLLVCVWVCAASWAIAELLPSVGDDLNSFRGIPMIIALILVTGLQLAGPFLLAASLLIGAASLMVGAEALRPASKALLATVLGVWGFVLLLAFLELADSYPLAWIAAAVIAGLPVVAVLVIALRHRKPRPGHCRHCGYNLAGLVSGVCPECGTPTGREG